jgi:hypothetical protein
MGSAQSGYSQSNFAVTHNEAGLTEGPTISFWIAKIVLQKIFKLLVKRIIWFSSN